MKSTITPVAKLFPLIVLFGCIAACDRFPRAPQEVGDLLNPDARRREAKVAAEASAAAEAATATALKANELAQANLKAVVELKADAAMIQAAKTQAEKAEAAVKAKEVELDKTKTRQAQATEVALKATELELDRTKHELEIANAALKDYFALIKSKANPAPPEITPAPTPK